LIDSEANIISKNDERKISYEVDFPASMPVHEVLRIILRDMEDPLNSLEGSVILLKDTDRPEFHEDAITISLHATKLLRILQKAGREYLIDQTET